MFVRRERCTRITASAFHRQHTGDVIDVHVLTHAAARTMLILEEGALGNDDLGLGEFLANQIRPELAITCIGDEGYIQ